MNAIRMRVHLHDEAPRIGSGWRIVTVLVGTKWVRLAGDTGRAKLHRALWADICRSGAIELPPRKKRRRKSTRKETT